MAETIRALRGHHEPQEELVFDRIVRRLWEDGGSPVMIEFGSFWTYYGLWFCQALPGARVVGLEPDPAWLEVGRRNAALNGLTDRVDFLQRRDRCRTRRAVRVPCRERRAAPRRRPA